MKTRTFALGLAVILALLFSGCRTTRSGSAEKSGFLKDYSVLKKGEGDEPLYYYMKPGFDPAKYPKALIEPVTIWTKKGSVMEEVPEEDRQKFADYFYKAIHDQVMKKKQIVTKPGEGVMIIRAALTEADKSFVPLDVASTVLPIGILISEGITLATGSATFAGNASAEVEARDSMTGELLGAGVDRRQGGKDIVGAFESWNDVYGAMQHWAEDIARRVSERTKKAK